MNKTININLGGIFFHIDELAYHKLKLYLDAIRRSLNDDPQGRDEILNDIEHRIGELLSERINDERQVVNENDIDEITKIMGKPEDYLVDEEIFEDEPTYRTKTSSKKLYRDTEDKFLGGVSSGIAHYFGVDPLWIRILWVILVIAGFGSGIPIYILLWVLIPQAETTAEKLQMKGEPVNISNIERKIREEFKDVSERVKDGVNDVTEKVKSSDFKRNMSGKSKSGLDEIIDVVSKVLITILKVLGKIIGLILLLFAAVVIILLIIGAFSVGSFGILNFNEFNGPIFDVQPPFFFDSIVPSWLLILFTFIAIGIPVFVIFMLGLKILSSNIKSFNSTTKLSLLGVWIIAILGLGFAGVNFVTQRAHEGVFRQTEELPFVANDTLKIKMIPDENLSNRSELRWMDDYELVYDNNMEKLYSTEINVDIKATDKNSAFVKIRKESEGNSRLAANIDAEAIEYQFNLNDKNLLLNGYFLSEFKNKYKDQSIDITIYIPLNMVIYLDQSTRTFLDDIDNVQGIYDRDMPQNYYKMTEKGLECLDCDPDIFDDDYKDNNFNLKIDKNGVEVKINDGDNNAEVKIDENGIKIN